MKLNFINRAYLALACIVLVAIVVRICRYKSWERYYYFSSISAPASYPVYVREAYFITADPNDDSWFDNRDVNDFNTTWGDEYFFPEVRTAMRLPEKLVLKYASYRDSKFYRDTLDLPREQIRRAFEQAVKKNTTRSMGTSDQGRRGLYFVLGIGNGGKVVLWLRGKGFEQQVLKTVIAAREPEGDDTYYRKRLPKQEYLDEVFDRLPDSLRREMARGWEAGASYGDSLSHYTGKDVD
ncbi:DUF2931 family protein [Taibaiella chishuiensis]|uniref:DUF2931 family protein n=1 Tax=Taibaiella chishuiensis TaxID=1434707 RepID=A0A2P8D821_9BACT|nr:DUF2931 family protein [Taibaiella chishuiensis]PSK93376.1 Protein of unknown function (DUF2931) [Taibaiella chishuiensis]